MDNKILLPFFLGILALAPARAQPDSGERAVDYYARQGDALASARQYPAALKMYSRAVDSWTTEDGFQKRADVNFKQARLYAFLGDFKTALADLEIAAELDPGDPSILLLRGMIHFRRKSSALAAADADQVLKRDKQSVEALVLKACAKDRLKEPKAAIQTASLALRRQPRDVNALIARGAAYYHAGAERRALADLDQALELDPKNPRGYFWRALVFKKRGMKGSMKIDRDSLKRLRPDFARQLKKIGAPFLYPLPFAD